MMMKNILFISLSFLLVLGSCKKEETHTCPIVDEPYHSIRANGYVAENIKVSFISPGGADSECQGTFMVVEGIDNNVDNGVWYYKVIGEIPDSVIAMSNYGNTFWLVDVTYLGIGIECYIEAIRSDPFPGEPISSDDVELVEVTKYEIYP